MLPSDTEKGSLSRSAWGNHMNGVIYNDEIITYQRFFSEVKAASEILSRVDCEGIIVTEDDWYDYFLCALAGVMADKRVVLLHPQTTPQSASKIADSSFVHVSRHGQDNGKWGSFIKLDIENRSRIDPNATNEFWNNSKGMLVFKTSGTTSDYEKYVEVPFSWMLLKSRYLSKLIGIERDDVGTVFSCPCFIQVFWTFLIHAYADSNIVFCKFGSAVAEAAERYAVTVLVTTASVVKGMVCSRKWELGNLKKLVTGGDYMDSHTLYRLAEIYPDVFYTCVYGCTETSAANVCSEPIRLRDFGESRFGIGIPSLESSIEIVCGDVESVGEICIKTPYSSGAYYPDGAVYLDENGYFHTGDLGYIRENGIVVYTGRKKSVINYNGQKIMATEVENAITELDGVVEAVVIGEPHAIYGEIAVCYLVVSAELSDDDLRRFLRNRLEGYKIPVKFVRLSNLPKTVSGKIIRRTDVYKELEENI